jgi:hypothetical protein
MFSIDFTIKTTYVIRERKYLRGLSIEILYDLEPDAVVCVIFGVWDGELSRIKAPPQDYL